MLMVAMMMTMMIRQYNTRCVGNETDVTELWNPGLKIQSVNQQVSQKPAVGY